jgi:hypothetical protein
MDGRALATAVDAAVAAAAEAPPDPPSPHAADGPATALDAAVDRVEGYVARFEAMAARSDAAVRALLAFLDGVHGR